MKQLQVKLQKILDGIAIVLLSNSGETIYVRGKLDSDIISQSAIEQTIKFCYLHGLHFYIDSVRSKLCLYEPGYLFNNN